LFLALTPPKAEYLISLLKPLLPQTWFMGVGISFSFLTGDVPRAPQWMQKTGLEWLFRLGAEPTRLFSRYIIKDIPFAFRLLYSSLKSRRARQMAGEP
ncbi:MAG: WecB/TagA/CpsF family glycosyltransferase, partial [Chlamydiia bacterium]|nr:WecB/TagA/CpsF family glycosyltransferase [Chlamydiia bacterium]